MPDMLGVWKRYQVNANRVFLNHLNQMEVWKCHCFRDVGKILGLNFWHYNLAYIVCTYDVGGDISRWFDGWDYVENWWVGAGKVGDFSMSREWRFMPPSKIRISWFDSWIWSWPRPLHRGTDTGQTCNSNFNRCDIQCFSWLLDIA